MRIFAVHKAEDRTPSKNKLKTLMISAASERPRLVIVATSSWTTLLSIVAGANMTATPTRKDKPWMEARLKAAAHRKVPKASRKAKITLRPESSMLLQPFESHQLM